MSKRKNSSGENIGFLQNRLFRDTFDETHIERIFIELFDNHVVDFILHIIVILYPGIVK